MATTDATPFTDLVGCRLPLQQAGMAGVATPELAVAVAEAGALGMLAMPMAPPEMVAAALSAIAARTTSTVGMNFLMPVLDPACLVAASDKARVIEFFYQQPQATVVDVAHDGGALAAWQVGSVDEARAAVDAGCDFVIAQGVEAGGHVRGTVGMLTLLEEVLAAVDVPVVAAGGIGTARDVAVVLDAGAGAVRIGTRFLAADEADIHPEYLARLIAANASDTLLTETFSVMWTDAPHRVLRSAVDEANAFEGDIVGEAAFGDSRMPVPRFSVACPTRSTTGTINAMALYAGESVGAVQRRQPAAEIVRELMA